jgi:hypothetical protein
MADEKKTEDQEKTEDPKKGGVLHDWSSGIDDQISGDEDTKRSEQMGADRR